MQTGKTYIKWATLSGGLCAYIRVGWRLEKVVGSQLPLLREEAGCHLVQSGQTLRHSAPRPQLPLPPQLP